MPTKTLKRGEKLRGRPTQVVCPLCNRSLKSHVLLHACSEQREAEAVERRARIMARLKGSGLY